MKTGVSSLQIIQL